MPTIKGTPIRREKRGHKKKKRIPIYIKMSFSSMNIKQLRDLISTYKAHHNIKGYYKMTKAQLVSQLDSRFVVKDNMLYLKTEVRNNRVAPTLLSTPVPSNPAFATPSTSNKSKGQQYHESVNARLYEKYKNLTEDIAPS